MIRVWNSRRAILAICLVVWSGSTTLGADAVDWSAEAARIVEAGARNITVPPGASSVKLCQGSDTVVTPRGKPGEGGAGSGTAPPLPVMDAPVEARQKGGDK